MRRNWFFILSGLIAFVAVMHEASRDGLYETLSRQPWQVWAVIAGGCLIIIFMFWVLIIGGKDEDRD